MPFLSITANAQTLQYQWANAITGNGNAWVTKLLTDDDENVYAVGNFTDTVDLDPGNAIAGFIQANGGYFLAKYNAQGNYLYALQFASPISEMAFDNDGNLWLAGNFILPIDADAGPGVTTLTSLGGGDVFVLKYTPDGNFISAFSLGGAGADRVKAMLFDSQNNLYLGGDFEQTVDFSLGSGTGNLTSSDDDDMYIAKYSAGGTLKFAFRLGTDDFYDFVLDSNDNIILSAGFSGSCDVDPGAGTLFFNSSSGGDLDGFWAKYDSSGNYIKAFQYEGIAKRIAIDNNDNFYIGGLIPDNTMDIDLGAAVQTLYTQENYDIYLVKYAPNDSLIYAKSFECAGDYDIEGITVDNLGNAYIFGDMPDTADFNPGLPGGELFSMGLYDGFITSFDANGNYIMSESIGSTANDIVSGITVNNLGTVWVNGVFNGTYDFNFEQQVNNLSAGINRAGFISKYHNPLFTYINETTEDLPLKIYGADNTVVVDFTSLTKTNAQVQVLNLMGQTVFETSHTQNNKLTITLPETADGIYFVRVINQGKIAAKKLFVK